MAGKPRLLFRNMKTGNVSRSLGDILSPGFRDISATVYGVARRNVGHFMDLLADAWIDVVQSTVWVPGQKPASRSSITIGKDLGMLSFSYGWREFPGGNPAARFKGRSTIMKRAVAEMISSYNFAMPDEKRFINQSNAVRTARRIVRAYEQPSRSYLEAIMKANKIDVSRGFLGGGS